MDGDGFECPHLPDHSLFRAAYAWTSRSNRPHARNFIKVSRRARGVSNRPFAAEFVEAPAFAMSLIAKCSSKSAGIEMRPPRAVLMDHPVIGKLRAAELIQFWQPPHRHVLQNYRQQVVRIGRTAWKVYDRLSRDHRIHTHRARGIRIRRRHSSPG